MSLLYKKKMVRKFKPTRIRKRTYAKRGLNKKIISRRKFKRRGMVPSGMPNISRTKMRYSTNVQIQSTLGAVGAHVFRCNSIFDPDYSGTGHQPMSHDTWASLFNHYTVTGAKIMIQAVPDSTNTTNGKCGIILNPGYTAPYTNASAFLEAKMGSYRNILKNADKAYRMKCKYSAKKFFNVSDVKDVGKLGAAFGTDPTEEAYFIIWYADSEITTSSIRVQVTIDYVVQFSEPKHLAQS